MKTTQKQIIIVSPNVGKKMGGEAIKTFFYFKYLDEKNADVILIAHGRCRKNVEALDNSRILFIDDDWRQILSYKSRVFRRFLNIIFHKKASKLIQARFKPSETVIHYLCPISPASLRFPPEGYRYVVGPLNGNIFYPPGFRQRAPMSFKIKQAVYSLGQITRGLIYNHLRSAHVLLVSGGGRTKKALRLSGCRDNQFRDVLNFGVHDTILSMAPIEFENSNKSFVFLGRLVDYKGADLAIKALARLPSEYTLTIFGDGPMERKLRLLSKKLEIEDRVIFLGWLEHDMFANKMSKFRGMLFPTLAEANGNVMMEAMSIGLPVITLDWGGPSQLASADAAIYIQPISEKHVIDEISKAMVRLAETPGLAQKTGKIARDHARQRFSWDSVAASWVASYNAENLSE